MEKNNKTYDFEFFTTFALLFLLVFSFGDILGQTRHYIICGLSLGMSASWFIRRAPQLFIKILTNTLALGILAWSIYKITNSSFLYKEVVLLCIKSTFFLITVLSFSARLPQFLNYMQVFSLLLFLEECAMFKNYSAENLILIAAYLSGSLILLKAKFHANFSAHQGSKPSSYLLPFTAFALISALAACVFFTLLPLKQIKTAEILIDGLYDEEGTSSSEEEMFLLQDKILEELTLSAFKLAETEQKHQTLNSFALLIQDSPDASSLAKAEESLLRILNDPDSGLNKISRQELSALIKKYITKKIPHLMERIKENLANTLQSARINLGKRLMLLQKTTKMQRSISSEELNESYYALQKAIEKNILSESSKKLLKEETAKLREWRLYQLYRKRLADISEKIDTYAGEKKENLKNMVNEINNMEKSSETQTFDKKIRVFKEKTHPKEENIALEIEELLSLKSDIAKIKERKKLQEKLRETSIPEQLLRDLEKALDNTEAAASQKEAIEEISRLLNRIHNNELLTGSDELAQIAKVKIDALIKKIKKDIEGLIDKSNPGEAGKELLQELAMMELSQNSRQVNASSDKLLDLTDKLYSQSVLEKENHGAIAEDINDLAQLLNMKAYFNKIPPRFDSAQTIPEAETARAAVFQEISPRKNISSAKNQSIKKAPAVIKIIRQKGWLLYLLARIFTALFLSLATIFLLFYFLTQKARKNICAKRSNRKEFIIALYENLNKILEIFGLKRCNYTSHLSHAASVTEKYIITDGLFRKLTERLEKAKYSKQEPEIGEDAAALSDYNAFLQILFSRHNKRAIFYLYLISLIKKIPITILTQISQ